MSRRNPSIFVLLLGAVFRCAEAVLQLLLLVIFLGSVMGLAYGFGR